MCFLSMLEVLPERAQAIFGLHVTLVLYLPSAPFYAISALHKDSFSGVVFKREYLWFLSHPLFIGLKNFLS